MKKQVYDMPMGDAKKTCGNCKKYTACWPKRLDAEKVVELCGCVMWKTDDRNRAGK